MKKERAFTLAELLAVITILGVIALIVFPAVNKAIKNSKEKSYNQQVDSILESAENWTTENMSQLSDTSNNYITIEELQQSGYLEVKKVINPITDEEMNGCIVIKYDSNYNQYTYQYNETSCDELEPKGVTFQEIMEPLLATGEVNNNDPDENLRYVGSDPDNYVWFNEELWRVIGIFEGQAKIIRNECYPSDENSRIAFDSDNNDWVTADLNDTFNNGVNSFLESIKSKNLSNYSYIDLDYVWNIGGTSNSTTLTRADYYYSERSETISSVMTNYLWSGAIGLMYPSDYGYASSGDQNTCDSSYLYDWGVLAEGDDGSVSWVETTVTNECRDNSWLYDSSVTQWTMTPDSAYYHNNISLRNWGSVFSGVEVYDGYYCAHPVLYFNSNVVIVDGKGTYDEPYVLDMK